VAGVVIAVSRGPTHQVTKACRDEIRRVRREGVEGDAHRGTTVKHRSRVARDASLPNLRQVHLIHAELHDELAAAGFVVSAGQMAATLDRDEHGGLVRKAGVMSIVVDGGEVRPGDRIRVELPPEPHRPLEPV
jgi:hypothetical protein